MNPAVLSVVPWIIIPVNFPARSGSKPVLVLVPVHARTCLVLQERAYRVLRITYLGRYPVHSD